MITGIGTDIINVGRVARALERRARFADRVYTPAEREYCLSGGRPAERFAGRFAAKEAVAKSLGRSLPWRDVEVLPGERGKPEVKLTGTAAEVAAGRRILVSISHTDEYAIAYAMAILEE